MFVKTVTAQHLQQAKSIHQNDMTKYASGHIPFANTTSTLTSSTSQHAQQPQHKTPGRSAPASAAKSSPFFPPSESIELPEIATDSEDEDPDDFEPPSWTQSPALRELLSQQQLVDPESVFGPIAPLRMDEVFRNPEFRDRQKKFRDRTSSANWHGADRLTEEERRRDKRAREILMTDGGWDMIRQKKALAQSPANAGRE
jgi:Inner centromere protein, ARK binding region